MIHVVLTTKNKSIYVKTLHCILGLESACNHTGLKLDITFVTDDPIDKMNILKRKIKQGDRLLWIDYGVSVNRDSIINFLLKYEGFDGLVFPVLKEGIDWDMFKTKCLENSTEPPEQMGMKFDTDVSSRLLNKEKEFYEVTRTEPKCWALDCKRVHKKLSDKKKSFVYPNTIEEFFKKCIERKVKLGADVNAKTYNHFTHECVGNIMNIPGLKIT